MYKEIPKAILSVYFGLFGENFVISFIYPEIKRHIMEEVCDADESLELKNFFWQKMFLVISGGRKILAISLPKPNNFMELF